MSNPNPLLARFYETAAARPSAPFLEGEETLTWSEAAGRITGWAEQLRQEAGRRPVLLHGPNTTEWVLCFLAAQAAGLPAVPLPYESTEEQIDEVRRFLGAAYQFDAGASTGLFFPGVTGDVTLPADADLCLPTSGSTGRPKLALRSAASLLAEGERYQRLLELSTDDRILAVLPLCHSFSLGLALAGAVAAGCALRLVRRFLPRAAQKVLQEGEATILPLVPSAARLLCTALGEGFQPLSGLRHVVIGAGPVRAELERLVTERLGRRPARNYGSTETGATLGSHGEPVPEDATGRPLPGVETAVAGGAGPGALFVRMTEPFLGYWTEQGLDASRVSPDGWFSTGDLAEQDADGWLRVTTRLGQGLRRGGRTILPSQIEAILCSHPAVADAVVTGTLDDYGEDVVEAHVETAAAAEPTAAGLRTYVEQRLESYKVPSRWYFYDVLPRTSAGKPDRERLTKRGAGMDGLFALLASHRLSAAVIAAHRSGLLAELANGVGRREELVARLPLGEGRIEMLLRVLAAARVLHRGTDDIYRLANPEAVRSLGDLVELELTLGRHLLSEPGLEALTREGAPAAHLNGGFTAVYCKVMGFGVKKIALSTWRRLQLPAGPVLDVGRPAGAFAEVVAQRAPERQAVVFEPPFGTGGAALELPEAPLAAVFLHNCVRYVCSSPAGPSLSDLAAALVPGGVLVISDIFIVGPAPVPWLRSSLMLDWAAFGVLVWPRAEDLCARLRDSGLELVELSRPDPLFDVIIARRPN